MKHVDYDTFQGRKVSSAIGVGRERREVRKVSEIKHFAVDTVHF
jgi:hypothetical protein